MHSKIAISALAWFHGTGLAMKKYKPDIFEKIKRRAGRFPSKTDLSVPFESFLQTFREDPIMSSHYDFLKKALTQSSSTWASKASPEPWSTIVHYDSWVNNIMFRNENEVKFVDFQHFNYFSPMRDLIFFLMLNLNDEVMKNQFDNLLDDYYERLMEVLGRMKCDTTPFTKEDFYKRMRVDSFLEFQHILFVLKVMTTDPEEGDDQAAKNVLMTDRYNPLLVKKMRRVVLKYAEKGWVHDEVTLRELMLV